MSSIKSEFLRRPIFASACVFLVANWMLIFLIHFTADVWGTATPDETHTYKLHRRSGPDHYFTPELGMYSEGGLGVLCALGVVLYVLEQRDNAKRRHKALRGGA